MYACSEIALLHEKIQVIVDEIHIAEGQLQYKIGLQDRSHAARHNLDLVTQFRRRECTESVRIAKDLMKSGIKGIDDDQSYYGSCVAESFLGNIVALTAAAATTTTTTITHEEDTKEVKDVHIPGLSIVPDMRLDEKGIIIDGGGGGDAMSLSPLGDESPFIIRRKQLQTQNQIQGTTTAAAAAVASQSVRDKIVESMNYRAGRDISGRNSRSMNGDIGTSNVSIDYNAVWNSSMSDCQVMNGALRTLLRQQQQQQQQQSMKSAVSSKVGSSRPLAFTPTN